MKTDKVRARVRDRYSPEVVLKTWRDFMQAVPYMNEAELEEALKTEVLRPREERRMDIVGRLHSRLTRVRKLREAEEYGL